MSPAAITAKLPDVMDSSMLSTWRSCNHKFFLAHCMNLTTIEESVDLHFGGAIARGLEVARKGYFIEHMSARDAETRGINAGCIAYGDYSPPERSAKTWENVLVGLKEYFKNWPLDQDPLKPVDGNAIEFSFAWPIPEALRPDGQPWLYGGRLDMLGDLAGVLYVVDEKTIGMSFTSSWAEQWDIRSQFMGYTWAAQQAGYPVERALVRGMSILKTKISFLPAFAYFPPYLISRWYAQLVKDLNAITRQWNELQASGSLDAFDRNMADACFSWNKPCLFKIPCVSENPLEWLTGSGYRVRIWDPLRQNPIVVEEEKAS